VRAETEEAVEKATVQRTLIAKQTSFAYRNPCPWLVIDAPKLSRLQRLYHVLPYQASFSKIEGFQADNLHRHIITLSHEK
jgi:hypothetical protein